MNVYEIWVVRKPQKTEIKKKRVLGQQIIG